MIYLLVESVSVELVDKADKKFISPYEKRKKKIVKIRVLGSYYLFNSDTCIYY